MIPPYRVILSFLRQPLAEGDQPLETSEKRIKYLIQYLLSLIPFDDIKYLENDARLAAVLADGKRGSARDHFLLHGYFEGRPSSRAVPGEMYDIERYRDRPPASYEESIVVALRMLDERNYVKAEESLVLAKLEFPSGLNNRRLLSRLYMNTGRPLKALVELYSIPHELRGVDEWLMLAKIAQIFGFTCLRLQHILHASMTASDFYRRHGVLVAEALLQVGHIAKAYWVAKKIAPGELGGNGVALLAKLGVLRQELQAALRGSGKELRSSSQSQAAFARAGLLLAKLGFRNLSLKFIDIAHRSTFNEGTGDSGRIMKDCLDALVLNVGVEEAVRRSTESEVFSTSAEHARRECAYLMVRAGKCSDALDILSEGEGATNDLQQVSHLARALVYTGHAQNGLRVCQTWRGLQPASGSWAPVAFSAALDAGQIRVSAVRAPGCSAGQRNPSRIPMTIMQYWNTSDPPSEVQNAITGWKIRNQDFGHILYSEELARTFMGKNFGSLGIEAFNYCHHPAMQADLLRLGYLLVNGGVYVDTDNVCVAPLSDLLHQLPTADIVMELKSHMSLNNAFICCAPGHPVMRMCFNLAQKNILTAKSTGRKINISRDTGPGVINDVIAGILLDRERSLVDSISDIALISEQDLRSYVVENNMNYKLSESGNWRIAS